MPPGPLSWFASHSRSEYFPWSLSAEMRLAFFSPLPPTRSGIADYSQALIDRLEPLIEVEAFSDASRPFDPSRFDLALYQVGNNPYHGFVYEAALKHAVVVVVHE